VLHFVNLHICSEKRGVPLSDSVVSTLHSIVAVSDNVEL
jgi:hypothetical protein